MKKVGLIEDSLFSVFGVSLIYLGLTNYFGNLAFSVMLSALGIMFNLPELMLILGMLGRHVISR